MSTTTTPILDDAHIAQQTTYAGFGVRFVAAIVDAILIYGIGYLIGLLFDGADVTYTQYISYVLVLAYNIGLHYTRGATLGKMIMKLRVVDYNLQSINLEQAFIREFFNYIYIGLSIISVAMMPEILRDPEAAAANPTEVMGAAFGPYFFVSMLGLVIVLVDCLWLLGNDKKQTLHDMIAKTYCVRNNG